MKTTYIGQQKFIERHGMIYRITERSEQAASDAEWADGILSRENVMFQNGRMSHEVAGELLDRAEDVLLDYLCITA